MRSPTLLFALVATACSEYELGRDEPPDDVPEDTDVEIDDTAGLPEDCNGEDDDGDGLTDEGFADLDGDGVADCVDDDCELAIAPAGTVEVVEDCAGLDPVADPWDATVEWTWAGLASDPDVSNVAVPPAVGQLTDDDYDGDVDDADDPDVAFVAWADDDYLHGTLVVADGATGAEHWTQSDWAVKPLALADLDGDGQTDIVGQGPDGKLRASSGDGDAIWTSATGSLLYGIADVDGDGDLEVVADQHLLDASTGALIRSLGPVDMLAFMHPPAFGDLDLDGDQEICVAQACYEHDGSVRFTASIGPGNLHWNAIVQADADPEREVAMIANGKLGIYDADGTELALENGGWWGVTGAPCVADFDGDGASEIAFPARDDLYLYDLDGTQVWSQPIDDQTGSAGCSGADLDGDGDYELLYADEDVVSIRDGATGATLWEERGHASSTFFEYPVVADIDGDGAAEVLVASSDNLYSGWSGVRAIGHRGSGWTPAAASWPDFDHAPADGLLRATAPLDAGPLPDLRAEITDACWAGCEPSSPVSVAVQVVNEGASTAPAGFAVTLYADDAGTLTLVERRTIAVDVAPGEALEATVFALTQEGVGTDGLVVTIDEDDAVAECDEADGIERVAPACD